ncbi:hypothetical protein ACFPK9_04270 [Rubritalea spongiae]|uniref:Uncharacterized protein n=1 Tax=Rubritalea spongiae TaxID=430797 RepID=A0ABW5EAU3_9BACT
MKLTSLQLLLISGAFLGLNSCMEQKVTDSSGNVIYEKTVSGTPWQSPEKTREQIQQNEEAMGIR